MSPQHASARPRRSDPTAGGPAVPDEAGAPEPWADAPVYEQLSRLGKALANPGRIHLLDLLLQPLPSFMMSQVRSLLHLRLLLRYLLQFLLLL